MIPVYVINLARSKERLSRISALMNDCGMKFTRINAVDGKTLSQRSCEEWNRACSKPDQGDWLVGQIGAFKSHMLAWHNVVDRKSDLSLILEDDMHLSDQSFNVLSDLSWMPKDADIVRLETTRQSMKLEIEMPVRVCNRAVRRLRSEAWGAGAYLLTSRAAELLVQTPPRLHYPVDKFLFDNRVSAPAKNFCIYQISPALAIQDKYIPDVSRSSKLGSTIEADPIAERKGFFYDKCRKVWQLIRRRVVVDFM